MPHPAETVRRRHFGPRRRHFGPRRRYLGPRKRRTTATPTAPAIAARTTTINTALAIANTRRVYVGSVAGDVAASVVPDRWRNPGPSRDDCVNLGGGLSV